MTIEVSVANKSAFAGLRVGLGVAHIPAASAPLALVHHMDHLLLDRDAAWPALQPDVVLQLGGRLTSKRLGQFLEWAALGDIARCATRPCTSPWPAVHIYDLNCVWVNYPNECSIPPRTAKSFGERNFVTCGAPEHRTAFLLSRRMQAISSCSKVLNEVAGSRPAMRWMYADGGVQRHDQAHLVTDRITTDLPALARQVAQSAAEVPTISSGNITEEAHQAQVSITSLLCTATSAVQHGVATLRSEP